MIRASNKPIELSMGEYFLCQPSDNKSPPTILHFIRESCRLRMSYWIVALEHPYTIRKDHAVNREVSSTSLIIVYTHCCSALLNGWFVRNRRNLRRRNVIFLLPLAALTPLAVPCKDVLSTGRFVMATVLRFMHFYRLAIATLLHSGGLRTVSSLRQRWRKGHSEFFRCDLAASGGKECLALYLPPAARMVSHSMFSIPPTDRTSRLTKSYSRNFELACL